MNDKEKRLMDLQAWENKQRFDAANNAHAAHNQKGPSRKQQLKFYALLFLVWGPMIIIPHEAGHMTAYKAFGVTVDKFSWGFGPEVVSYKYKGTEYKLSLLPLGGYVQVDRNKVKNLAWWKNVIIASAGPLVNFLMFLLLLPLLMLKRKQRWNSINLYGFWGWFTFLCLFFAILNILPLGFFGLIQLDGSVIFLTIWQAMAGTIHPFLLIMYMVMSAWLLWKMIATPMLIQHLRFLHKPEGLPKERS